MHIEGRIIDHVVPMSLEKRNESIMIAESSIEKMMMSILYAGIGDISDMYLWATIRSNWDILSLPVHILIHILEYASYDYLNEHIKRMLVCKLFHRILAEKDSDGYMHRIHLLDDSYIMSIPKVGFLYRNIFYTCGHGEIPCKNLYLYAERDGYDDDDDERINYDSWRDWILVLNPIEIYIDTKSLEEDDMYDIYQIFRDFNGYMFVSIIVWKDSKISIFGHVVPNDKKSITIKTYAKYIYNMYLSEDPLPIRSGCLFDDAMNDQYDILESSFDE